MTPLDKFVREALAGYKKALRAERKVDEKTARNIYDRGADDFAHFLRTGKPLKRDERAPR
jgi:hypothetical protein